jgi:formate C-acetyltransferase
METLDDVKVSFKEGTWNKRIDVKDFVRRNITSYYGDASFLAEATDRTKQLWQICLDAMKEERQRNGCRSIDTEKISTITSHGAGYINKELELIVGLQTDELLK